MSTPTDFSPLRAAAESTNMNKDFAAANKDFAAAVVSRLLRDLKIPEALSLRYAPLESEYSVPAPPCSTPTTHSRQNTGFRIHEVMAGHN